MGSTPPSRRKGGDKGGPREPRERSANCWWHTEQVGEGEAVAGDLFSTYATIRTNQSTAREEMKHHLALYSNMNVSGQGQTAAISGRRQRYNLTKSAVDTGVSLVAQQRPRPMFVTTDGMWGQQQQARLLTQALSGQLYDLGMYQMGPDVCRDGCVSSTGWVYGYLDPETKTPKLERLLPGEGIVDHNDGLRRAPRSAYRRRLVARDVLYALYPKKREIIEAADGPSADDRSDLFLEYQTTVDQVALVEGWHLRSSEGSKDGRRVMALSSGTLLDEPYEESRLPFAFYRWSNRAVGFDGEGIVEQCRDAQWRINQLIAKGQRLSDLGSNAWVMVNGDAKVRTETLTNDPMKIVRYYGGTPPQVIVNDGVPPSIQAEIEQIKNEKFQELGFSQMRTMGEVPAGIESGKAIRAYEGVSDSRHNVNGRIYEDFFLDVTSLLIVLNQQAAKVNPNYKVRARSTRGGTPLVSQIKWSEIYSPENALVLQMWPTAQLPSSPSGKMQAVQEWVDGGWVSRPFAQSLLDFPDLDATLRLQLADMDLAMDQVEQILDGDSNVEPDGYQDLQLAADVARRSRARAKILKAPASVILALEAYIDSAIAQSAPPPPVNAMSGAAGAAGVAGIDPNMMIQDPSMAAPSPGIPPAAGAVPQGAV